MSKGKLPGREPGHNAGREKITAASAARPCPVCGGDHKCGSGDGGLILCGRRDGPVAGFRHLGPSKKDPQFHLYRAEDDPASVPAKPRGVDWPAAAARHAEGFTAGARAELARVLDLPIEVFDSLPLLGANREDGRGPCWTFPECDGGGRVVGITRRYPDGVKKAAPGGRRGLTLVDGWRERAGPVLLPEGPSDTLALIAAGGRCGSFGPRPRRGDKFGVTRAVRLPQ
jgi:hypothetical protein